MQGKHLWYLSNYNLCALVLYNNARSCYQNYIHVLFTFMECNTKNGVFCLWDHLRVQICTTLENEMRSQLKLLHGKTIRKKKNVVTVIFTFEKWFDEIQNIFIMYIDFSHRFYHANISYTTFSLSLSLSLSMASLSSNHYSFSTDLFAGSQYTWKLLFIFLTPDSSPLRIKIFARKCFTNNHGLHCLPNYIKIFSLLYGL